METNHKSKHEKLFAPWFVQSVGKCFSSEFPAFGLPTTSYANRVPSLSQHPQQTTCKPVAQSFAQSLRKPTRHTNKKAFAATMSDDVFFPSGERLPIL